MYPARSNEIAGNIFRRVDGNSEADARGCARWRINRRINPNYVAVRIDERPAGIAAINRCVGLDGFFDKRGLASNLRPW